jgi:hypothetical protein
LTTNSGADLITGVGQARYSSSLALPAEANGGLADLSYGIYNDGLISTGTGVDVVDAMVGGFGGSGLTDLGGGSDVLRGFGDGYFDGGTQRDLLTLNKGNYEIVEAHGDGSGYYLITNGNGYDEMFVKNFESVTTASGVVNFSLIVADGSFTV